MTRVLSALDLRYIDGRTWELLRDFQVETVAAGLITVEAGEKTDFNSIPRGLWNILPPDEYGEAAVAHDHLYAFGILRGQPITRELADQVHRELVQFRHAPRWKVHAMYYALRLCGGKAWNHYREAERVAA